MPPASDSSSPGHVMDTDAERDELSTSPSPFPIPSPSPRAATATRSTRTLRSHRARNTPQAPHVKASATPAAAAKSPKRSRAAPRRVNKSISEMTAQPVPAEARCRRGKRPRTPAPPEDLSDGDHDSEGEREETRPLSRHRSRSRSLSIIPTVDMPPLTHPAPDDAAVRALGLAQSSRPGAATLSLNRDHLIRMREGHFARTRPGRKKDENRNWKNLTMSEAAWTRLEEIGCVTKGRAWTAHGGYDDDGNPVKPDLPYVILTKLVIASSPRKMLTLNQIYQAMEERWPYFKKLGQTFRNSIRHNLSMNPAFVNVERPLSEGGLGTGKGGYWKVSEDTTTSHRGRGKKPRLEAPADGRTAVDLRSPTGVPTGNAPLMETYTPRPLVHIPLPFDTYPGYAHPSHISYAAPTHAHGSAAYARRASHYPKRYERSTAFANHAHSSSGDHTVLLSPVHSLPEASSLTSPSPGPTRRTSSLDVSPGRSSHSGLARQPRPVHTAPAFALHASPPSLIQSSFYATQSPPDHRIATPPCDGLSSLMQLANAAETDHAKTRPSLAPPHAPHAPYAPTPHRLPSVNALLNGTPVGSSHFTSSPRPICG